MMREDIPVIRLDDVSKIVADNAYTYGRRVRRRIYFLQQDGNALCLELDAQSAEAVSIGAAEALGQSWPEAEAPKPFDHGISPLLAAGKALLDLINSFGPERNMRSLLGLVGLEAVSLMEEKRRLPWLREMELSAEMAASVFGKAREDLLAEAAEQQFGQSHASGPTAPPIGKTIS